MAEPTQALQVLQHSLGLDQYGKGKQTRNHFVTSPGDSDWDECTAHVAAGRMTRHGPGELYGGDDCYCFTVTPAGVSYVREHSPQPPKVSKGKALYQQWLDISDMCPDLSFGEWIKKGPEGRAAFLNPSEHYEEASYA
jgi:hypothetical protein